MLFDGLFPLPEAEDHHVLDGLQGFDHGKHLKLHDRVMGCIHEGAMKADIRCTKLLVRQ